MTVYCVSYDLIAGKDYTKIIDKIKSYGAYAHAEESLWFIKDSKAASELREELKSFLDGDDKLIVIKVTLPWASFNLSKEVNDWLKTISFD